MSRRIKFVFFLLILLLSNDCTRKKEPIELKQAAHAIYWMMAPLQRSRSAFSAAFQNPKPSQFVSYLFSDMGAAEWPPSEDYPDIIELEELKRARLPVIPAGVSYSPLKPDVNKGKQIVVKYNDDKNIIIVEGYIDPQQQPVLLRTWDFLPASVTTQAKFIFDSNRAMGLSYQSF